MADAPRDYDATTDWQCAEPGCDAGGALQVGPRAGRRIGFLRHLCYGHGPARDPGAPPVVFDVCAPHAVEWQRRHGLDAEPDWVRRARVRTGQPDPGPLDARPGDTVITSRVGNGE